MVSGWDADTADRNTEALGKLYEEIKHLKFPKKKNPGAAGDTHPSKASQKQRPPGNSADERYARKAIEDEIGILLGTAEGDRNNQLNKSTFALGQLVGGGLLEEGVVVERMTEAGRRAGLDEGEVRDTVRSGLEAGKAEPRTRPENRAEQAQQQIAEPNGDGEHKTTPPPAIGVSEAAQFPADVLPGMLWRFATEGAKSCRCPIDYFAVPMVVVAANMIGGSRCLQIHEDWRVYPALYLAVVGTPGSGKSPALSKVMSPAKRQHVLSLEEFKRKARDWKNSDPKTRGDAPTFDRVYTTDATGEKLAGILQECPRGLMLYKDELTAWIRGMDQYKSGGKGTERQMYLSCWSNEGFSVERKSNEDGIPISVHRPVFSVLGGIQPDLLPLLADNKGRADGFLDRILFCYPERVRKPWTWDGISPQARNAWRDVLKKLRLLEMTQGEEGLEGRVICLTDSARLAWEEWQEDHEEEQASEEFNPALYGPWAKMDSQLARIALTLHLLFLADRVGKMEPDVCPNLDGDTVYMAAQVVEYLKQHVKRSLGLLEVGQEERQVQKAVQWIKKRGGSCTLRDVYTHHVSGVKKASEAQKLLDLLVDYGLGKTETIKADNDRSVCKFTMSGF